MSVGLSDSPRVVHGLEDGVGGVVRVSGDLDEVDVLQKPVDEVGQGVVTQFLQESRFQGRGIAEPNFAPTPVGR